MLFALMCVIKPVTRDIITTTEKKEAAERERGALERQAEIDANIKERNADLRQATHDMLGPVRAVNTIATSILKSDDIAYAHQAARHIKNGLSELDDLMREVVVMSQIVTQLKTATDEIIDMGKLSDYFHLYLTPIASERNIHLTVDDAPYKVMSNAWLLKRIIYNLLMNAINHGDEQTFVRLYLRKNRKWCYVRIWDTGPGIPNANGSDRSANFINLLDDNYRAPPAEEATTTIVGGYGLGLRGVMRMSETLGITMSLVSKVGKGTVFRFRIPLADPDKAPTASQEDALFERHLND